MFGTLDQPDNARMGAALSSEGSETGANSFAPVTLAGRDSEPRDDRVCDPAYEIPLTAYMIIERHRADTQMLSEAPHGERPHAVEIKQVNRFRHYVLARERTANGPLSGRFFGFCVHGIFTVYMLLIVQVLAVFLVAIAMALALAHALEMPGKMRLTKETYLAVQPAKASGWSRRSHFC